VAIKSSTRVVLDHEFPFCYNYGIQSKKGFEMGYRIIADRFETDMMRQKYGPRKGLEGPFKYASGRVLYYDPREGRYYDPTTDFYLSHEEMDAEHGILVKRLVDFQK
jgi:hypothetical protein